MASKLLKKISKHDTFNILVSTEEMRTDFSLIIEKSIKLSEAEVREELKKFIRKHISLLDKNNLNLFIYDELIRLENFINYDYNTETSDRVDGDSKYNLHNASEMNDVEEIDAAVIEKYEKGLNNFGCSVDDKFMEE